MKSSQNQLPDEKESFVEAVLSGDEDEALKSLRSILAGNQMFLPGFMPDISDSNFVGVEEAEKSIKRAAEKLMIPKNVLQMAFGRCPDFFKITEALVSPKPTENLEKLEPEVFRPVRPARPLRYSNPALAWEATTGGKWIIQHKMDGWYCQIHAQGGIAHCYSRNGKKINISSQILQAIIDLTGPNRMILECELIGFTSSGNMVPVKDLWDKANSIKAFCFDLLYFNGDWTRKPYQERFTTLKMLISSTNQISLTAVHSEEINQKNEFIDRFNDWSGKQGLEGMIARRPDLIYEADCSTKKFLKIKIHDSVDAVVIGYIDIPRSYLVGVLDEKENEIVPFAWITISALQSDPLEADVKSMITNLPTIVVGGKKTEYRLSPNLVVEIEGDKIYENVNYPCGKAQTGTGWSLQQARISRIRTDKNRNDATTVEAFLKLDRAVGY